MESVFSKLDAERAELELLLSSKKFPRTNNLGRFLGFICEKYFEGSASDIKEYSIAVEALGRPPEFDPQVDCIVRVTAHNLRKHLELYYATEGSGHAVHLCLPPGHYVPQFVHVEELPPQSRESPAPVFEDPCVLPTPGRANSSSTVRVNEESIPKPTAQVRPRAARGYWPIKVLLWLVLGAICMLLGYTYVSRLRSSTEPPLRGSVLATPLNASGSEIHALIGGDRKAYVDRSGLSWLSDRFCAGGASFSVTGHTIQGTEDSPLFASGRRGVFHCKYPVPPGVYEVHLLFAETSALQEASRNVAFSINGGPPENLDVVDDAGGDDIATAKVLTDVAPTTDGTIHLDFTSPEAFANAVEILPGSPHRMLPVRIVVGHSSYRDFAGNVWLSDRYFFGGRLSSFGGDLSKVADGRLYEWHRFGHFHYVIPVATGKYTVKLHFMEHWFGVQNGGIGGVGSRVFDVSCNGSMLLRKFDIFREAGPSPLVRPFPHIEPTPQGKIEIYFTPDVNYPSISAIEVIPE